MEFELESVTLGLPKPGGDLLKGADGFPGGGAGVVTLGGEIVPCCCAMADPIAVF